MALVLGVGVGTFLVVLFFIALLAIWTLSVPCSANDKILARLISTVLIGIAIALLFAAPKESIVTVASQEEHVSTLTLSANPTRSAPLMHIHQKLAN